MTTLRSLLTVLILLVILSPSIALANAAGDFQKGIESYQHGKSSEAAKWFRKAADQGYVKAQYFLGLMYHEGAGVIKDYAETVKWYRRAAAKGHVSAQSNLGKMYENGHGVLKDDAEAQMVPWATDQGHANAQHNLALMYHKGQGVIKDHGEAVKWYRRAADQGYVNAQFNLDNVWKWARCRRIMPGCQMVPWGCWPGGCRGAA